MFVFDLTNVTTLILIVFATILFVFLSQEIKKSLIVAIPLFAFIVDLIVHTMQLLSLTSEYGYLKSMLSFNIALDFTFILITFLAYLWADDVEAKALNKKTVNAKGINWLFKKV